MADPKNESYCIYTQQDLIHLGILKNVCGIESMCQMNEKRSPACLSDLRRKMVTSLGTEFIENEKEEVSKQDCENAAAKRLL